MKRCVHCLKLQLNFIPTFSEPLAKKSPMFHKVIHRLIGDGDGSVVRVSATEKTKQKTSGSNTLRNR